jgi:hypothetical protein
MCVGAGGAAEADTGALALGGGQTPGPGCVAALPEQAASAKSADENTDDTKREEEGRGRRIGRQRSAAFAGYAEVGDRLTIRSTATSTAMQRSST